MQARSLLSFVAAIAALFCLPALRSSAQVVIRERAVINPGRLPSGPGSGGSLEGLFSPCNPPIGDLGPPVITRLAIYPGETVSLAALTCPFCPEHHMAGELTQGAEYVRLELNHPPGLGGEINGTSFHFREAWGYDVHAIFDQLVPDDSALVKFTMTYVDFPPPNIEYIEIILVRRQFRSVASASPVVLEQGWSSEVRVNALDQCGGAYPAPVVFTAGILAGGERGSLENPLTHEKGQTVSGLLPATGYTPTVVFVADGMDPDSTTEVRIQITSSVPEVIPALVVLRVKTGGTCPVVRLEPPDAATGDTVRIVLMRKKLDGTITPYSSGQLFSVMLYPDEAGTLFSPHRPDTADYFDAVPQDGLLWLASAEIPEESVSVYIWVTEVERVEGAEVAASRKKTDKADILLMADRRKVVGSFSGGQPSNLEEEICNAAFSVLKPKPFEIMLGETKYYQARQHPHDPSRLIIDELQHPMLVGGIAEDVWQTSPVSKLTGEKCGVYWEKKYPIYGSNGRFVAMADLPRGLVRLVGRHWTERLAHRVALQATHDGRVGRVEIEVHRPNELGDTQFARMRRWTRDVSDFVVDVDSLCFSYGGVHGIPPQLIKGHIEQEAAFVGQAGVGFAPSYLYEPYTVQFWDGVRNRTLNPFFATDASLGTVPPPLHQHVELLDYFDTPHTLWEVLRQHSELLEVGSIEHKLYGKRRTDQTMDFGPYKRMQAIYDGILIRKLKKKQLPVAALEADSQMAAFISDKWRPRTDMQRGARNMVAQTRIASSYGLLQMLYVVALTRRPPYPENLNSPPENLNETDTCLSYSLRYQKRRLVRALGAMIEDGGSWPLGYEGTFLSVVLPAWNSRAAYPGEVMRKMNNYTPRP